CEHVLAHPARDGFDGSPPFRHDRWMTDSADTADPTDTADTADDGDNRTRMLRGEWYLGNAPELLRDQRHCHELLDRFNTTPEDAAAERQTILGKLLGGLGENTRIMPRLQCDYGYPI